MDGGCGFESHPSHGGGNSVRARGGNHKSAVSSNWEDTTVHMTIRKDDKLNKIGGDYYNIVTT